MIPYVLTIHLSIVTTFLAFYIGYSYGYYQKYHGFPVDFLLWCAGIVLWPLLVAVGAIYGLIWLSLIKTKYSFLVDDFWYTKQVNSPKNKGIPFMDQFRSHPEYTLNRK